MSKLWNLGGQTKRKKDDVNIIALTTHMSKLEKTKRFYFQQYKEEEQQNPDPHQH